MPEPKRGSDRPYGKTAIERRLRTSLPLWTYDGTSIRRLYRTQGWKSTAMAFGAVAHLAEATWHHPDVAASWDSLEVRLHTHSAKGVTDKDFALAALIEAALQWQSDGVLEGTPDDPRFAHVKRDAPVAAARPRRRGAAR